MVTGSVRSWGRVVAVVLVAAVLGTFLALPAVGFGASVASAAPGDPPRPCAAGQDPATCIPPDQVADPDQYTPTPVDSPTPPVTQGSDINYTLGLPGPNYPVCALGAFGASFYEVPCQRSSTTVEWWYAQYETWSNGGLNYSLSGGQDSNTATLRVYERVPTTTFLVRRVVNVYTERFNVSSYVTTTSYSTFTHTNTTPPPQPPTAVATYAPTGQPGQFRLSAAGSTANGTATITGYEWIIPGVGLRALPTVDAVIPRTSLPANVTLKVTDSLNQSTTTSVTVDDGVFITGVDLVPRPAVVGGDPVTATMSIKNTGAYPLTDVTATVQSATPDLVSVTGGPTPASISIDPGQTGTLAFTLEALQRGTATLNYRATADDGGRTLTDGPKQGTLVVQAPALQAALQADAGPRTARQPFPVRAVITNTGDTTLTDIRPAAALVANGIDGIDVTGPLPASVPSLAPGASATLTYTVTADAGTATFAFTARATDPVAGPITSNTARLDKQVADGLVIESVTADRSDDIYGTARGGELIAIRGRGFTDVTQVGIARAGSDQELLNVPVTAVDDSLITFTSPNVVDQLRLQDDGTYRFPVDIYVSYPDPVRAGEWVDSNAKPYSFQGPVVTEVVRADSGETTVGANGGDVVTVRGSGFTDVTTIALFPQGSDEQVYTDTDLTIVDDTELTFTAPDVVSRLELDEDGIQRFPVDLYAAYPDANAPGGAVQSNPSPLVFVGPSITTVTAQRSGTNLGGIKGSEQITITGTDLTDVNTVSFRRPGTNDVLATVSVSTEDDSTLTFDSPNMAEFVSYVGDDQPGGVNTEVFVSYEPAEPADVVLESNAVAFDFQGPKIDSLTAARSGGTVTSAKGEDEIRIEGSGLYDVTELVFYRTGTDERLAVVDVSPALDGVIVFTSPSLTRDLQQQDDGISRVKVDVVARILDTGAQFGEVNSNPARLDLNAPGIESVVAERTNENYGSAKGGEVLTVTGSLLKDATAIAFFRVGTDEQLRAIPLQASDDAATDLESPSMTRFLLPQDDGMDRTKVDIYVAYPDDDAPGGQVVSNPVRFDFNAPVLESIQPTRSYDGRTPVKGGDEWVMTGYSLTDVTRVVLYRAGSDEVLDISDVEPTNDSELTFTTPGLVRYLLAQDDRLDRVKVDVRLEYLDSDAPDGVVRSGAIRFDFTPPFIDETLDGSFDPDGTSHFTLAGGFFDDVDLIVFRDPQNPDQTITTTGRIFDDETMEVDLPDMTRSLRQQPDGTWAVTIEVSVGYVSDTAPRWCRVVQPRADPVHRRRRDHREPGLAGR